MEFPEDALSAWTVDLWNGGPQLMGTSTSHAGAKVEDSSLRPSSSVGSELDTFCVVFPAVTHEVLQPDWPSFIEKIHEEAYVSERSATRSWLEPNITPTAAASFNESACDVQRTPLSARKKPAKNKRRESASCAKKGARQRSTQSSFVKRLASASRTRQSYFDHRLRTRVPSETQLKLDAVRRQYCERIFQEWHEYVCQYAKGAHQVESTP